MALEVNISKSQDDMDEQFIAEYVAAHKSGDFKSFAEDWGMSEEDAHSYAMEFSPLEDLYKEEIVSEWEPDYSKTAEYEGTGITSELIPGEGLVAPILAGMGVDPTTAAVIGAVATKKPGMLTNKLFAGKKLKANQLKNRGAEGPVVQGASRTLKDSNLRPSIKNKTADRYKSMSDRVKKQNATAVAFTGLGAGLVADRMLKGNRNEQGDFVTADDGVIYGDPELAETDNSNDEYDYYGNRRAVTKIMNDPDGFLQRQMRKKSTTGTTQRFTQDDTGRIVVDDEIGFEEPTGPDMVEAEERPGWQKNPGANWWSVNSKSDYWQTDDGAEEAFELYGEYPSWVKQPEVQELDWSSWFK
jgi:hypothetical protein